jgi:hypothetical protein
MGDPFIQGQLRCQVWARTSAYRLILTDDKQDAIVATYEETAATGTTIQL